MDWSRIKTTLIIALVLMNLILGSFVWLGHSERSLSEKEHIRQVTGILNAQQVVIDIPTVDIPEEMPVLDASYELYDLPEIAKRLYADEYYEVNGSFVDSHSKLEVFNKNTLIYQVLDAVAPEEITPEEALTIAETFIDRIGLNSEEKVLESISLDGDETVVIYAHEFNKQFVNGSFISIRIKGREVVFFERQWLRMQAAENRMAKLIPLSKAYYSLIGEVNQMRSDQQTKVEIVAVALGYVMDQRIFDTKIQSGEAFPYFRFTTSTGTKIYVEAIDKGR